MLDCDDLRFFLAVARHHTLSAAARQLRVTQSTVSRRLTSLQEGLGVRLLPRTTDGYVLTLAGESIRAHVERVEAEALSVEHAVPGHDVRLEGTVRVASTPMLTSHILAPCFAALHARHDGILIEAFPTQPGEPLITNDADIVVRLRRFDHNTLVARNIGIIAFGLYGSVSYLARRGEPDLSKGCAGHHLISLSDDHDLSAQATWLSDQADRARVVLKADSYETQHWAAYCGGGLALLPCFRASEQTPSQRCAGSARRCQFSLPRFGWASTVRTPRFRVCGQCWTASPRPCAHRRRC